MYPLYQRTSYAKIKEFLECYADIYGDNTHFSYLKEFCKDYMDGWSIAKNDKERKQFNERDAKRIYMWITYLHDGLWNEILKAKNCKVAKKETYSFNSDDIILSKIKELNSIVKVRTHNETLAQKEYNNISKKLESLKESLQVANSKMQEAHYAVQCALENRNDYLEKLKDLK